MNNGDDGDGNDESWPRERKVGIYFYTFLLARQILTGRGKSFGSHSP